MHQSNIIIIGLWYASIQVQPVELHTVMYKQNMEIP